MVYPLGAKPHRTNPKELQYALVPPSGIDLSQPLSLLDLAGDLPEQKMSDCVANAAEFNLHIIQAQRDAPSNTERDRLFLYARGRQAEGDFPQDNGMEPATVYDLALAGVPAAAQDPQPYGSEPAYDPPHSLDAGNPRWISAHQPFYAATQGSLAAGIVHALSLRQPLSIALPWYQDFDAVIEQGKGVMPVSVSGQIRGYHNIAGIAWSGATGYVLLPNWWGPLPNDDVRALFPQARPGMVAMHISLLDRITNDIRAIVPAAVIQPPAPKHFVPQGLGATFFNPVIAKIPEAQQWLDDIGDGGQGWGAWFRAHGVA